MRYVVIAQIKSATAKGIKPKIPNFPKKSRISLPATKPAPKKQPE